MACSYISAPSPSRVRRKCALFFFLFFFSVLTAKINKQTSPIHLSVLAWPSPRCGGAALPTLAGLKGFVLFCCQDDQWLVCDSGERWPGPHSRSELSQLGNTATCTCCSVARVFQGQWGGRTSRGLCFTGNRDLFLNDLVTPQLLLLLFIAAAWACVASEEEENQSWFYLKVTH